MALKEDLGQRDIKTTLIYAHLSPAHFRAEIAKTERPETSLAMTDALSTSRHTALRR